MATFSAKQSSQLLFPGKYGVTSFTTSHLISGLGPRSFSQMYADRAVAFLFFSVFKLFLWAECRFLKLLVDPMYFFPAASGEGSFVY